MRFRSTRTADQLRIVPKRNLAADGAAGAQNTKRPSETDDLLD